MQSNGRLNDSRANISHLHKTKKPFTQPATGDRQPATGRQDPAAGSSEQQSSSERMNRGGGG